MTFYQFCTYKLPRFCVEHTICTAIWRKTLGFSRAALQKKRKKNKWLSHLAFRGLLIFIRDRPARGIEKLLHPCPQSCFFFFLNYLYPAFSSKNDYIMSRLTRQPFNGNFDGEDATVREPVRRNEARFRSECVTFLASRFCTTQKPNRREAKSRTLGQDQRCLLGRKKSRWRPCY